jgi:RND family efflux transporter MFP subunit
MRIAKILLPTVLLPLLAGLTWLGVQRFDEATATAVKRGDKDREIPVEVAVVRQGTIELQRNFTGTLEAHAAFLVAPKVGGRIEQMEPDISDPVSRNQVVARLDHAEYVQQVAQAEANLTVARANLVEAESLLEIAERELDRFGKLQQRGVSSASQHDAARADQLARQAHLEVARAQLVRSQAELETARIRLGYTEVTAAWRGGSEQRVVAERYVDEGETVTANTPLLRIVELDPISAVFHVTESDYGQLHAGLPARIHTDAYPQQTFAGAIERVAPVFRENSRQARVELRIDNPDLRLKPGMFVRATLVLQRVDQATLVPAAAVTRRGDRDGLFQVVGDGKSVRWRELRLGIRQDDWLQLLGEPLQGQVVVLGQQMLDDGSAIAIVGGATSRQP